MLWLKASPPFDKGVSTSEVGGSYIRILRSDSVVQLLAYYGRDIGAMIGLVDRSLALNPSFARGWFVSGHLRMWAGQPDLAIEHIENCDAAPAHVISAASHCASASAQAPSMVSFVLPLRDLSVARQRC